MDYAMVASVRNEEGITASVEGIDKLKAALTGLPDKLRRKVLLSALRKGAAVVRKAARDATPVLQIPSAYRTKGLLRKRLMVRVSRESRSQGNVGVFVNIKPASGTQYTRHNINGVRYKTIKRASQRGAKSPLDPFYWRYVAFGTKKMPARNFLQAGANALPRALEVFEREVVPAIEKFNHP
jgi:HK97 gp10 family phage protein